MRPKSFRPLLASTLAMALLPLARAGSAEPPAAAPGEAGPEVVEWRVVDAAHHPIPGAVVWETFPEVLDPYRGNAYPPPVARAVSGEDGRFSTRGIDLRHADLRICRDGYLVVYLQPAAGGAGRGRAPALSPRLGPGPRPRRLAGAEGEGRGARSPLGTERRGR
jgi:hypothetical protein